MNSIEKKKRFRFDLKHDNFILKHFVSLKNTQITKNKLYKQITKLCNQQSQKTSFFDGKIFQWKAIANRITNFIDPQINHKIELTKQQHYKIFMYRSQGKSNIQTKKLLELGNIPQSDIKNAFKIVKQHLARSIHILYKVKFDQMSQKINQLYDQENKNHFRAVLVLFSKGKLLQQYGNNQNLIKIPKLLKLADQYWDLSDTFDKLSKKGTQPKLKDQIQKRLSEIARRFRNALKRIYNFYIQINKKGIKFSHKKAKNLEQLCQEIIMNDQKGQKILADKFERLKHVQIQLKSEDILLDLEVIRTTQDAGQCYQIIQSFKIQGTNTNSEIDFQQITRIRGDEHFQNQPLRQIQNQFIQLHQQDKYSDCFFSN